jgi:hypothetical protein
MSQQGRPTTLQQRTEIWERAQRRESDGTIAQALGLSAFTVRKWRRKAKRAGRRALTPRLGRPATGPLGQSSPDLREMIRHMRVDHPGWGPQTIRCQLACDPSRRDALPSRARLAAFLHHAGLVRPYQRHQALPAPTGVQPRTPHQQWQLDAKGVSHIESVGRVSLINAVDCASRLKLTSWPCLNTTKPTTLDDQMALRAAFLTHGLPESISLDHDTAFYDSTCPSPYPTPLHLWLLALNIDVVFIRQHRPQDHGCIERTHQTIEAQALKGQHFADEDALRTALAGCLVFLNTVYPCRSLGGVAPLVAYPEARHSARPYRLEWEESLLDLQHVYAYLTRGKWFRRVGAKGQFYLGALTYGLGKTWANQTLEITFDSQTQEFICLSAEGARTVRLPAQGLTKQILMGELTMVTGPSYQPMLPFDATTWRQYGLFQLLPGTTL